MVDNPERWKKVTGGRALRRDWHFGGHVLKRAPKGYPPGHPLIDDLKRTDYFVVRRTYTQQEATSPDFMRMLARDYRNTVPFMQFLCEAIGLRWE